MKRGQGCAAGDLPAEAAAEEPRATEIRAGEDHAALEQQPGNKAGSDGLACGGTMHAYHIGNLRLNTIRHEYHDAILRVERLSIEFLYLLLRTHY